MFFHESLQLLLHLADLNPKPFSLGALLGRFLFGLSQRLLQGCHLGCGPYNKQYNPVISSLQSSISIGTFFFFRVFLTFFLLELPRSFLRTSTCAVSAAVDSSEACIR